MVRSSRVSDNDNVLPFCTGHACRAGGSFHLAHWPLQPQSSPLIRSQRRHTHGRRQRKQDNTLIEIVVKCKWKFVAVVRSASIYHNYGYKQCACHNTLGTFASAGSRAGEWGWPEGGEGGGGWNELSFWGRDWMETEHKHTRYAGQPLLSPPPD